MVDDRNSKLRLSYTDGASVDTATLTMPSGNYNGISFSAALETLMNTVLKPLKIPATVNYDLINNKMTVLITDTRAKTSEEAYAVIETGEALGVPSNAVKSLNGVMMLDSFVTITPLTPSLHTLTYTPLATCISPLPV